jgi:two-component system, OmpR family, KDP operon response regulator KdpE
MRSSGSSISSSSAPSGSMGADYGHEVDYLRVFIKNLRKKIELNPGRPEYITTEPWVGYRFAGAPESS